MSGISSKALAFGNPENKKNKFQDQELNTDLGVNYYEFKWRHHDYQIGRFIQIDPLASDYEYNSTYAFSENKVTNHVELEGLEATAPAYLREGLSQWGTGIARGWDKLTSFFTRSEVEVSRPSSTTNSSTVVTTTSTTEHGTNLLGWLLHSKSPDATVSNGPSLFKSESTNGIKVELKQEVKNDKGTVSTKTALDGSSLEVKVEAKTSIRKVPVIASVSNSQNFQTGENKTKVKVGAGTSTNQAFGQVEIVKSDKKTTTNVSVGVEEKTGNVKKSFSIGKSF
jgi:RHS repeat-associated protein